jgi:hypothetical protein
LLACIPCIVTHLPALWDAAGGGTSSILGNGNGAANGGSGGGSGVQKQSLLRASIVETLRELVKALKNESVQLYALVLPVLSFCFDAGDGGAYMHQQALVGSITSQDLSLLSIFACLCICYQSLTLFFPSFFP